MVDASCLFEQLTDAVFADLLFLRLLLILAGELADLGRVDGVCDRAGVVIHLVVNLKVANFVLL